jgi:hypothetical protein
MRRDPASRQTDAGAIVAPAKCGVIAGVAEHLQPFARGLASLA